MNAEILFILFMFGFAIWGLFFDHTLENQFADLSKWMDDETDRVLGSNLEYLFDDSEKKHHKRICQWCGQQMKKHQKLCSHCGGNK
jgi:hypothetical protein